MMVSRILNATRKFQSDSERLDEDKSRQVDISSGASPEGTDRDGDE
jgi:hypothetical protein